MVTITSVRVSPDLSVSKVFLSIFPAESPDSALFILNQNKKFFRSLLAKSCRHQLRIVPEIIFYLDDSDVNMEEIDRLLNQ